MPILKYRRHTLQSLSRLVPRIHYVMCGARGESTHRLMRALPQMHFFGFEPDPKEFARLTEISPQGFTYFPVAVGGLNQEATLYVTRNPACSSLVAPDFKFLRPYLMAPHFDLAQQLNIDVVSLDHYLPAAGVQHIDFLDLDTQGSELEILQGAQTLLSSGTAVVKCEVEFAALYRDQPLFGDVDRFLRENGFLLFDLSRSRCRRRGFPSHALTRGQLLWSDALYLRDYQWFVGKTDLLPVLTLCLLAVHLQFHDYALEILDFLQNDRAFSLTPEVQRALADARSQYLRDLSRSARWTGFVSRLESIGLKRPIKLFGRLSTQLGDRLRKDRLMMESNWED